MTFDIIIIAGFLLLNLFVGLRYGQKITNIKDYALGNNQFSTGQLISTIVATTASSSAFFLIMSGVYTQGAVFLLAIMGTGISYFIISSLSSRMKGFLGKNSIAEALGDLYGNKVRVITAVAGTIGTAGFVAVQLKACGSVFSSFLHLSHYSIIIIIAAITIVYAAFGGIRAVILTDILQFITFGAIVPIIGFVIWNQFTDEDFTFFQALNEVQGSVATLFDSSHPRFLEILVMFAYFATPGFGAPVFQRVAIASSVDQVKKAFFISGILLILVQIIIALVPLLMSTMNVNVPKDEILDYVLNQNNFVGFRGILVVAVIAFAMSTADSYFNSASVLFTNDICKVLLKNLKNEILVTRVFVVCFGTFAIILSLIKTDLISIIVLANSFYYPLVSPPFLLAVFGFRSSTKCILGGMAVGFTVTIIWKILPEFMGGVTQKMIGVLFAMSCNALFVLVSYYFFKQPKVELQEANY